MFQFFCLQFFLYLYIIILQSSYNREHAQVRARSKSKDVAILVEIRVYLDVNIAYIIVPLIISRVLVELISHLIPFFKGIVGVIVALRFCPLICTFKCISPNLKVRQFKIFSIDCLMVLLCLCYWLSYWFLARLECIQDISLNYLKFQSLYM